MAAKNEREIGVLGIREKKSFNDDTKNEFSVFHLRLGIWNDEVSHSEIYVFFCWDGMEIILCLLFIDVNFIVLKYFQ